METPARDAPKNLPWARYWAPADQAPLLEDGFLIPPGKTRHGSPQQSASLKFLSELEAVPCLVLLGSPGLGKSRELAKERDRLTALAPDPDRTILHVDLKNHGRELFCDAVFASDAFAGWVRGENSLTLLLDSLDECWEQVRDLIPTLVLRVKSGLARIGHPELRVRLGCRAAEWRGEATAQLTEVFGKPERNEPPRVQIHQLAPLSREDVALAARGLGLPGAEAFMADLAAHDLNALAAHPLTLDLLLEDAREGRPLGPTRADVYRRGMLRLAHDPHEQAGAPSRNPRTTKESRLVFAARLAAQGILSRRYLYRLPNSMARPSAAVLEPGDLIAEAGAVGATPSSLDFDPDALRETYRCGLFRGAGADCVTWQHQAYAEFLAADFLADQAQHRGIKATEILLGLISDTSAVAPRVYPPLEELALWLVDLHPPLFDRLLPANADLLSRCDTRTLTAERRAGIVDTYFDLIRRHDAEAQGWNTTLPLVRLKHAGLANQLRPVLLNRREFDSVRRTAIAVAEACECRELAPDFVNVVFEPDESFGVTQFAASRLVDWADTAIRTAIRERIFHEPPFAHLELRGAILSVLWPTHLSAEELTPFLTHGGGLRMFTAYDAFLTSGVTPHATREHFPTLLRWAANTQFEADRHEDGRIKMVQQLARCAFDHIDDAATLAALVQLALAWRGYRNPHLLHLEKHEVLRPEPRRRFLIALFPHVEEARPMLVRLRCGILHHDDLDWAVQQVLASNDETSRQRWVELVYWLTCWHERADIERIWSLVGVVAGFEDMVRERTSMSLDESSPHAWTKKDYYAEQERVAKRAALRPLEVRLLEALDIFETGRIDAMWWLVDRLQVLDDDETPHHKPIAEQGRETRGSLSDSFHARLRGAAGRYLEQLPVSRDEVLRADVSFNSYVIAIRLIAYLMEHDPQWPCRQSAQWWEKYMLPLLAYEERAIGVTDEIWAEVLATGHAISPTALPAALRFWLPTRATRHVNTKLFAHPAIANDLAVQAPLIKFAKDPAMLRGTAFEVGAFLMRHGCTSLETWLKAAACRPTQQQVDHPASLATAILLLSRPEQEAPSIVEGMLGDLAWAKAVLHDLHFPGGLACGWVSFISPHQQTRVWEMLKSLVPNDPYGPEHDGSVTLNHEIYHLQNHVLNHLGAQTTPAAVAALEELLKRCPDDSVWLGQMLARVRRAARREGWTPITPLVAARFLDELGPRPIATLGDLCDAVMDSLERYQAYLRGPNRPTELWNEPTSGRTFYEPKDENVLSNCLVTHLRRDLGPLGVWAEREVEVRRGTAAEPGDNPDIVVFAPNPADPAQPLRLYVEVKCAWNVEALTGLGEQLFERYLRTADCGVYLLAHYTCTTWTVTEDWRRNASLHRVAKPEAETRLHKERVRVQALTDKRLAAFFLDAGL